MTGVQTCALPILFENSGVIEIDMSKWDMSKITKNKDVFKDTKQLEFLTFKGLPEETELTAFAGEYIVGTLNSNGDVILTEGPFNKNNKYKFKKNTPYKGRGFIGRRIRALGAGGRET